MSTEHNLTTAVGFFLGWDCACEPEAWLVLRKVESTQDDYKLGTSVATVSGYLTVVLREIRRLGSGFSQVDSVFHKNYTAGCVHGVRTRLTFF